MAKILKALCSQIFDFDFYHFESIQTLLISLIPNFAHYGFTPIITERVQNSVLKIGSQHDIRPSRMLSQL